MNGDWSLAGAALHRIREQVAATCGFRPDAIRSDTIQRVVSAHLSAAPGISPDELHQDQPLLKKLVEAVSVGETFFFRQPEHFTFLARWLAASPHREGLRAWSAGCATGEEAYSLAACLLAIRRDPTVSVEVVGTDLVRRNVDVARRGLYGSWSIRTREPLWPAYRDTGGGNVAVLEKLREVTRFWVQNLLGAPPRALGMFDVVFCRNVLVYFAPEAAAAVVAYLVSCLAPEGLLVFGPMDVDRAPAGTERVGPGELNVFVHARPAIGPRPALQKHPAVASARVARPACQGAKPRDGESKGSSDSKAGKRTRDVAQRGKVANLEELHCEALRVIERGEPHQASQLLDALLVQAPDYVPAILERALLHERFGEYRHAQRLMRQCLRHTPADRSVESESQSGGANGDYYRASALAFFERRRSS